MPRRLYLRALRLTIMALCIGLLNVPDLFNLESYLPASAAIAGQASAPDLVVTAVSNPPASAVAGGSFSVTDTTRNSGNASAAASTTRYQFSTDTTITASDVLLTGTRAVPALGKGGTSAGTVTVSIPNTIPPGTYYLGACADALATVPESNEANNCRASSATINVSAVPSITSISPSSGTVGTVVTITGSNFGSSQGNSTVAFNGTIAAATNWTNSQITAAVPDGATGGPVIVTVNGRTSNGVPFSMPGISYIYDAAGRLRAVSDPANETAVYQYDAVGNLLEIARQSSSNTSIIEFEPKTGTSGVTVHLHGTGFNPSASQNTVTFNGIPALVISATSNHIQTSVPAGATSGPISVTTATGSATTPEPFIIASRAPVITGIMPKIGLPQSAVTITGNNFDPAYGNNRAKFNDRALSWMLSGSTTSLMTTVPTGATSGRISVIAPAGSGTATEDFFVPPFPNQVNQVENTARTAIGQSIQVALNATDKVSLIVFDGTAGQQILLAVSNVTVSPHVLVRIYNPDGSVLASNLVTGGANLGPYNLATTGTYQILLGTRIITTIAGNGFRSFSGDGGPATSAGISRAYGTIRDSQGNLFIADTGNNRVRKVNTSGIITTIAGTGTAGFSGDGNKAVKAQLNEPYSVAVDSLGNVFVADRSNHRIRKITTGGAITTVAGTGVAGFSGDGGPATAAQLRLPQVVTLDSSGNLYIGDTDNSRLRKVTPNGIITTIAGTGAWPYNGDGIPATSANLNNITSVLVDPQGNIFLGEGLNTSRVRKINTSGIISTFAGTGTHFFNGDNIPATQANISFPNGLARDTNGNIYIADGGDERIRRVDTNGIITTVVGTGAIPASFNGDTIPAHMANLNEPSEIIVTPQGDFIIADAENYRIRKVTNASPGSVTVSLTTP
jgi:YD repeat-containing protein